MIFSKLTAFHVPMLFRHDIIWQTAFDALSRLDKSSVLGTTYFNRENMYINVHAYDTKQVSECRFEGHREMIDVQYVINGGEYIDWALKEDLETDGPYLLERDFQYYKSPSKPPTTRVHLQAGYFGIFFPEDGHRPQINDGISHDVLKAVVKIPRKLLVEGNV